MSTGEYNPNWNLVTMEKYIKAQHKIPHAYDLDALVRIINECYSLNEEGSIGVRTLFHSLNKIKRRRDDIQIIDLTDDDDTSNLSQHFLEELKTLAKRPRKIPLNKRPYVPIEEDITDDYSVSTEDLEDIRKVMNSPINSERSDHSSDDDYCDDGTPPEDDEEYRIPVKEKELFNLF